MRLVTYAQLRELVDFEKIEIGFIKMGFELAQAGNNEPHSFVFTSTDTMTEDLNKYALDRGWDPETTLFLYEPPKTEEERAAIAEQTKRAIEEDPDWDDIQIGYMDPKQIHGSIYRNMTIERFVECLLRPWNMRAFS